MASMTCPLFSSKKCLWSTCQAPVATAPVTTVPAVIFPTALTTRPVRVPKSRWTNRAIAAKRPRRCSRAFLVRVAVAGKSVPRKSFREVTSLLVRLSRCWTMVKRSRGAREDVSEVAHSMVTVSKGALVRGVGPVARRPAKAAIAVARVNTARFSLVSPIPRLSVWFLWKALRRLFQ